MKWKLLKVEKETEPKCWHCQTNIKYACWIENQETFEVICVGRDCCSNFLTRKECKSVKHKCDALLKAEKFRRIIEKHNLAPKDQWAFLVNRLGNSIIETQFPEAWEYGINR